MMRKPMAWVVLALMLTLAGCSSLTSEQGPLAGFEGLTYYMPKRDFVATVSIKDDGSIDKVAFSTTSAYPDTTTQYALKYQENAVGKNTLDVGIGESGLLTSTKSTTVSNINDIFKSIASIAGAVTAAAEVVTPPKCPKGDYPIRLAAMETKPTVANAPCGVFVGVERLFTNTDLKGAGKANGTSYSGVFYRQNLPYILTASLDKERTKPISSALVFSSSESPTYFLPVAKTLFSNNQADFTFTDGVPTKYNQDVDGELVALFKLPADVIAAYFNAIGAMFDNFKSVDTKQGDALTQALKLQLTQQKYQACVAAINAGDKDKITALGCGQ